MTQLAMICVTFTVWRSEGCVEFGPGGNEIFCNYFERFLSFNELQCIYSKINSLIACHDDFVDFMNVYSFACMHI